MRAGPHRVAFLDAVILPPAAKFAYSSEGSGKSTLLVDERFGDPTTSGLSFTVPDQTVWEIVVEKPR